MMADLAFTVHENTGSGHVDFAVKGSKFEHYKFFTRIVMDIAALN
jgi:hypothetical protein